uniref:Uncharacterized protein n=1 Tax=Leersia perrieri TaxID=77586 RepID=A0A0D9W630_9ORYZ
MEAIKQRENLFRVACDHCEDRNRIFVDGTSATSFYSSTSSRSSNVVVDEASMAGGVGGEKDPFSALFDEVLDEASMWGGGGDEKDPFSALFRRGHRRRGGGERDRRGTRRSLDGGRRGEGPLQQFSALSDEVLRRRRRADQLTSLTSRRW